MQSITESEQTLLKLLLMNSRLSTSALGDKMGKGRNWVARTIKRLVRNKVIRAYVTVLDPAQVYAERSTILFIKTNPRELGVSQALLDMSELESLDVYLVNSHYWDFSGLRDQVPLRIILMRLILP